jgi:hypothetical protein
VHPLLRRIGIVWNLHCRVSMDKAERASKVAGDDGPAPQPGLGDEQNNHQSGAATLYRRALKMSLTPLLK